MSGTPVSVTYTAEIKDLRKKLASIPDITGAEARKAVGQLNKSIRAIERQQAKAAKAAANQAQGLKAVGEAGGEAESSLRAVSGVVGMLAPEAEGAISVVAELGGALEGVARGGQALGVAGGAATAALGAAGVAVVATGAAYHAMREEAEKASAALAFSRDRADELTPAYRRLEDAQLDLAHATGVLTDAQADVARTQAEAQRSVQDFGRSQAELRKELRDTIETSETVRDVLSVPILGDYSPYLLLADAVGGFSDKAAEAERQLGELDRTELKHAEAVKETREVVNETAAATRANTAAVDAHREALDAARAAQSAYYAEAVAAAQAEELMRTLRHEVDASLSGDEEVLAIEQVTAARLASLDTIRDAIGESAEMEQLYFDIVRDEERALAELQRERFEAAQEAQAKLTDQAIKDADRRAAAERRQAEAQAQAVATFFSGAAAAAGAAAENAAHLTGQARRRLMVGEKVAGVTSATINGAVAATKAYAQLGPIFGPLAAAGIAAATAAQVSTIVAQPIPSFSDTPGVQRVSNGDRQQVSLASGDYFAAAKDREDLARQVAPPAASEVRVVAVPSYEGRLYRRAQRDSLRTPGPLSNALATEKSVGPGGW